MLYSSSLYSGKKLSFIGLGTWKFGEEEDPSSVDDPLKCYWGGQKRLDSIKTIRAALRAGITHFDTAQVYGRGRSEQIVGQEIRKIRDRIILADKFVPYSGDFSKITAKVDLSLRRLNSDYIDIFYIHWPSRRIENALLMEQLEKVRRTGKIRYIGVSNFSRAYIEDALRGGDVDFCQTGYSVFWRKSERDMIPFCLKKKIKLVAYGFFGQGIFTRSCDFMDPLFKSSDARKNLIFFDKKNAPLFGRSHKKLLSLASENGVSVASLLIAWGREKNIFESILTGAGNRKQIEENSAAADMSLPPSLLAKVEEISLEAASADIEADNIFDHKI